MWIYVKKRYTTHGLLGVIEHKSANYIASNFQHLCDKVTSHLVTGELKTYLKRKVMSNFIMRNQYCQRFSLHNVAAYIDTKSAAVRLPKFDHSLILITFMTLPYAF